MATVTVRPNSTVSNAGWSIVGGVGSVHATLADDNDAHYVEGNPSEIFEVGFPAPTIPAGAIVKSITLRARTKKATATPYARLWFDLDLAADPGGTFKVFAVTWSAAFQTHAVIAAVPIDAAPTAISTVITHGSDDPA